MNTAARIYNELKEQYQTAITEQTRTINLISNVRLAAFLIAAIFGLYFIVRKSYGLLGGDIILFLALFIPLVLLHDHYFNKRKYAIVLHKINENSLKRIQGEWNSFTDDGAEFFDLNHRYLQDLDIFGKGSLFQFMNNTVTFLGRRKLRDFLIGPAKSIKEIITRQEAIRELAPRLEWRQYYMAEGLLEPVIQDPQDLFLWVNQTDKFYLNSRSIFIFRLIPVITIFIGIFEFINPEPGYYLFIGALVIQFILLKIHTKQRENILGIANKYVQNIKAYHRMLNLLEDAEYDSTYLRDLKTRLKSQGMTAGEQIHKLEKIAESIANRHNQFYFIFNVLFLLDYQFVFALEKWKEQSGSNMQKWLDIIAECEVLSSLAGLTHDFPEWTTPEFSEEAAVFKAEGMAHPLLLSSAVANDLKFEPPRNILLITGSNMSGKSTLLRTAGINLVLAYAGGDVCAQTFKCSLMDIYTCMRVNDNLEKNISSFYAELMRIKMMVKAVEEGHIIFFLLDEIFKGTNSIDRHTGARVLIKKLSNGKLLGLVSTHDLELGDLEKESPRIKNYHFEEYYNNNQIYFDYKLRPGVSSTRNAAYLMKLAGIDFTEE